jgi:hypothetical protein
VLAQIGGRGRLALGAILGAGTAALFLLGVATGGGDSVSSNENPLPLAAVAEGLATASPAPSTAVLSATVAGVTTRVARPTRSTVAPVVIAQPTSTVGTTTVPPPPTEAPPTTVRTTTRTPRPTRTRNPCWFIFC